MDDPSTSTIRFHHTEMPHQLISWDFTLLFLTKQKSLLAVAHVDMLEFLFFQQTENYFSPWKVSN